MPEGNDATTDLQHAIYTVFRFVALAEQVAGQLPDIGNRLNASQPGCYSGREDVAGKRISCEVFSGSGLAEHIDAITIFLHHHAPTLRLASSCGMLLQLDCAVYLQTGTIYEEIRFPAALLQELAVQNIELVVTAYSI